MEVIHLIRNAIHVPHAPPYTDMHTITDVNHVYSSVV